MDTSSEILLGAFTAMILGAILHLAYVALDTMKSNEEYRAEKKARKKEKKRLRKLAIANSQTGSPSV